MESIYRGDPRKLSKHFRDIALNPRVEPQWFHPFSLWQWYTKHLPGKAFAVSLYFLGTDYFRFEAFEHATEDQRRMYFLFLSEMTK